MKLSEFSYELPSSYIAQKPLEDRDQSKLMVLRQNPLSVDHHFFQELPNFLNTGDVLVLNDTKVFNARLIGTKPSGGKVEILLLKNIGGNDWEALVKPSNRFKISAHASINQNGFAVEALDDSSSENGTRLVRLHVNKGESAHEKIEKYGHVPLPPYIKRMDVADDKERYQTVFAEKVGAIAAPTAGLHFTPPLLEAIKAKGVTVVFITLHVGYGTFKPVAVENVESHRMHPETFLISKETAEEINSRKGRLIACGTTSIRALETASDSNGKIHATAGTTELFIFPPYRFKTADLLITNFHLPRSTLLMLVSAFGGHKFMMSAYEEAKHRGYRFYSYGDAMLLERA